MLGLGIPPVYSIIQEMKLEVGLIGGFYDIQHCQPILQAVIILVAMVGKKKHSQHLGYRKGFQLAPTGALYYH